jgi:hypothetical protein
MVNGSGLAHNFCNRQIRENEGRVERRVTTLGVLAKLRRQRKGDGSEERESELDGEYVGR